MFSPFFNSYKSRRKNLLEASVVLIQALIRSPEQCMKGLKAMLTLEIENQYIQDAILLFEPFSYIPTIYYSNLYASVQEERKCKLGQGMQI